MRQHLSREAATEIEHQTFLSSLRDFGEYLIVFRWFTPTATSCHRFAVKSVQLQNTGLRSWLDLLDTPINCGLAHTAYLRGQRKCC